MTSEGLTNEIRTVLAESGFTVHTGAERKMNATIKEFPAAWLAPLKLSKVSGVNEGIGTYKGLLTMMAADPKDEGRRIGILDWMERMWSGTAATLMQKPWAANVKTVRVTPGEALLTGAGELSSAVEFEVEVYF